MNVEKLTPADELRGEDEEDTALLKAQLEDARAYIRSWQWCRELGREYLARGIGGVVAVFLFDVGRSDGVTEAIWVIVGDLPSAYVVTDSALTASDALERYCELMEAWIEAVQRKSDMQQLFPVRAEATVQNAERLERRVKFLRREVLPLWKELDEAR